MELEPKKDRMEVLMSDVTFIAWISLISLALAIATLTLVVILLLR